MERHTKQNYLAECCADKVSTVQEKFRDTAHLSVGNGPELEEDRIGNMYRGNNGRMFR